MIKRLLTLSLIIAGVGLVLLVLGIILKLAILGIPGVVLLLIGGLATGISLAFAPDIQSSTPWQVSASERPTTSEKDKSQLPPGGYLPGPM